VLGAIHLEPEQLLNESISFTLDQQVPVEFQTQVIVSQQLKILEQHAANPNTPLSENEKAAFEYGLATIMDRQAKLLFLQSHGTGLRAEYFEALNKAYYDCINDADKLLAFANQISAKIFNYQPNNQEGDIDKFFSLCNSTVSNPELLEFTHQQFQHIQDSKKELAELRLKYTNIFESNKPLKKQINALQIEKNNLNGFHPFKKLNLYFALRNVTSEYNQNTLLQQDIEGKMQAVAHHVDPICVIAQGKLDNFFPCADERINNLTDLLNMGTNEQKKEYTMLVCNVLSAQFNVDVKKKYKENTVDNLNALFSKINSEIAKIDPSNTMPKNFVKNIIDQQLMNINDNLTNLNKKEDDKYQWNDSQNKFEEKPLFNEFKEFKNNKIFQAQQAVAICEYQIRTFTANERKQLDDINQQLLSIENKSSHLVVTYKTGFSEEDKNLISQNEEIIERLQPKIDFFNNLYEKSVLPYFNTLEHVLEGLSTGEFDPVIDKDILENAKLNYSQALEDYEAQKQMTYTNTNTGTVIKPLTEIDEVEYHYAVKMIEEIERCNNPEFNV
jgi:hypothetical protein